TRWRSSSAAARSMRPSTRRSPPSPRAPTSSTSATASCRKRRSPMSSACWRGFAAAPSRGRGGLLCRARHEKEATMVGVQKSGVFEIGGTLPVHRLGFGAMRITGRGIWGEPADRAEALRVLRRLPEIGVDFIDTADSYGPNVSERLIREALAPYPGLVVATKAGLTRSGPDKWTPRGDPEYLIKQAHASRERLGVEIIDLWQLHRIDSRTPRDEQFAAIKSLLDAKVIRHAGLSEVSVAEIEAAAKVFPVATVQNRYNLGDRASEAALDYCERNGIGF